MDCIKCGATDQKGKFCSECGAELVEENNIDTIEVSELNEVQLDCNKKSLLNNKKFLIGGIAGICLIIFLALIPVFFKSVDKLCSNGEFQKAYEKADKNEKKQVAIESMVAVISKDIVDSLKDEDSFELKKAWYFKKVYVLEVKANNSYGAKVSNYWLYSTSGGEAFYFGSFGDLEEEEIYYSIDSASEREEKKENNEYKRTISGIINGVPGSEVISDKCINDINQLYKDKKLKEVKSVKQDKY